MSKQLDLDFNSTVTISTPTSTYTMCDSDNYWSGDNITVTTDNSTDWSTITGYDDVTINTGNLFEDLPVRVGKYELTEKSLEKVFAVIDIFENDEDLKDVLKSQIALNRIKNDN